MEKERLIQTAQTEIDKHLEEANRLKGVALDLITNAEWHCNQADSWNQYLAGLVTEHEAVVIPLPRRPEVELTLLQGGRE